MSRIMQVSYFFRMLFQAIFIALPILLVISWIYAPNELVLLNGFIKLNAIPSTYSDTHVYAAAYAAAGAHFSQAEGIQEKAIMHILTNKEKIIGCLVSAVPTMLEMFILYFLIQLFKLYEKGEIFSVKHVNTLRYIGYALLMTQLIEPFYQFAMGLVLTLNNPPHHHYAAVSLSQKNIGILLISLMVILISWIMAEGYKLREEQKLTI